ncbi:condensation domain-containing protein [Streptosporangium lutulentum]
MLHGVPGGGEPSLEELPMQYMEVAAEDRRRAEQNSEQNRDTSHLDHWTRTLTGVPALDLPTDRPRLARWTGEGAQEGFLVPDEVITRLEEVARRQRCTLFMALLAAYQATLGIASGQRDLCVGVPVAGRNRAEIEPLIGYFATTLVFRADLSGAPTFRELMKRTRLAVFKGLQHAEAPFEQVLGALRLPRDLSYRRSSRRCSTCTTRPRAICCGRRWRTWPSRSTRSRRRAVPRRRSRWTRGGGPRDSAESSTTAATCSPPRPHGGWPAPSPVWWSAWGPTRISGCPI